MLFHQLITPSSIDFLLAHTSNNASPTLSSFHQLLICDYSVPACHASISLIASGLSYQYSTLQVYRELREKKPCPELNGKAMTVLLQQQPAEFN